MTYTAKSNSTDELGKLLTTDKKGNTVMNLQIRILDQQFPIKATNTKELVTEVQAANRDIVWLTYRKNFEPLLGCFNRSDAGWGCMIRTAQMLLHEALRRHTGSKQIEAFNDTEDAMFGIHRISQIGITLGKKPGEWYGPQTVLHSLKGASKVETYKNFRIAVCSDGNIFLDKIFKKISKGNSVFVGIPMRLGINKVMKEYLESVKIVFDISQNVGIAGGQDHKSLYFTGIVNSHINNDPHLLYLDPHFVQESST